MADENRRLRGRQVTLRPMPEPGRAYRREDNEVLVGRNVPGLVATLVVTVVLAFLSSEAPHAAPSRLLTAWLVFMDANLVYLIVIQTGFAIHYIRYRIPAQIWLSGIQLAMILFCTGMVIGVWILMPPANAAFRMVLIFFDLWFIAMAMMIGANWPATIGCLALAGSLVTFLLTHNMPYRLPIVGLLVLMGASLLVVRRLIWRVAEQAVEARLLSERAKQTLEATVAIVSAERDAKTRFIASATHDLQQPIQAARLFVDQALDGGSEVARGRAALGARTAFASVQALLESMLDHLRLEAGAITARTVSAPLDPTIDAVALEHSAAAAVSGITIIVRASGLSALHEPHLLRRALGNLVGNAIRHSKGSRVLIGVRRDGGQARIWVLDDGVGVPPRDVASIFDDFAQGSDDRPESHGGFGLGLPSARRLAQLQGGEIGLDTRWRSGAAFFIALRGASRPRPAAAAQESREAA